MIASSDENSAPGSFLPAETLANLRDMGGWPCAGGRRVKRGLLFRSSDLGGLSAGDRAYLSGALGIKTVVDFRGELEKKQIPDILPENAAYVELPIDAADLMHIGRVKPGLDGAALMQEIYRSLPGLAAVQYREFFRLLCESSPASQGSSVPLLFHCTAGKDRTGVAGALFLLALGTELPLVYEDYLLSAKGLERKYRDESVTPAMQELLTVKKSYLAAAFESINTLYGGVENYLSRELVADIEKLRSFYTESVL